MSGTTKPSSGASRSTQSKNPETGGPAEPDCTEPDCTEPDRTEHDYAERDPAGGDPAQEAPWSRGRRLLVRLPMFIILLGILVFVSNATAVPWNNDPTGQTLASLDGDTDVIFDDPTGETAHDVGDYDVVEKTAYIDATRASTGETQRIRVLIRQPEHTADPHAKYPAMLFMHGAGHGGSPDDSFFDVAESVASAGFVTAVMDKPVWSTTDIDRDYQASADAYDQVLDYLRGMDDVDATQVGLYATSESTWISSYLLRKDHDVAFQILLSPMVFSPRQSLGFFVAQDFTLVGANDGYQSIVRRVFSLDTGLFGLDNLDLDVQDPQAYAVPTFVVYGSKDVMTAQVEGAETILDLAHRAGNWDVTIRSYPLANHVLRMGHDEEAGTPFADDYVEDLVDWTLGTLAGLTQTSERVAGSSLYQTIAVPKDLHAHRVMTVYLVLLLAAMIVVILLTAVMGVAALIRRVVLRRSLGFVNGFGGSLLRVTVATLAALILFAAGLGQVIMGVVNVAWGTAPDENPGIMQWSWPVIQVVSTLVVWSWSGVLSRLYEVARRRGIVRIPPRRGAIRAAVTGSEPVLASTRFGRVLFWLTASCMGFILLFFAFWGLFIY